MTPALTPDTADPGTPSAASITAGRLVTSRPALRDRVGAALLAVCALGAVASVALAVPTVLDAEPATQGVETWRMIGYAMFAGVFALLAQAPRQLRGLWELTILSKLALPAAGLTFASGADEAGTLVVVDGVLVAIVVAAYVLMAGWTAARPGAVGDGSR